jgi:hypothetical protein
MEWLDGETLADRLVRGAIGPVAAARMGSRVLRALAAAHRHGIVHRDIKPSNLFLPAADLGQAKLLDFGIARRAQDDLRVTGPGKTLGTPMYMAPEQARDGDAVDGRADIFSLGCVLYECATGEPPPSWASYAAEARTWDDVDSTWLSSPLPRPLREVLSRMLAVQPGKRPDSAEDLATELEAMAETLAANGQDAIPMRRPETLSGDEQRVAAVVMLSATRDDLRSAALRGLLAAHGARAECLANGTTEILFTGKSTPLDQATQAARCALRLKAALPDASLGISTSRADMAGKLSLADVIDQAGRLLATTPAGTIVRAAPRSRPFPAGRAAAGGALIPPGDDRQNSWRRLTVNGRIRPWQPDQKHGLIGR